MQACRTRRIGPSGIHGDKPVSLQFQLIGLERLGDWQTVCNLTGEKPTPETAAAARTPPMPLDSMHVGTGKFATLARVREANSAAEKALAFEQSTNYQSP